MPFDALTLQEALKHTKDLTTPHLVANRAFVRGDHWQGSLGWVGPLLAAGDATANAAFLVMLERTFVSQNVMGEGVGRHVGGVVGQEPAWDMVSEEAPPETNEGEEELADPLQVEADEALTTWWDKRNLLRLFQQVTTRLLYDADDKGGARAYLRFCIPVGRLINGMVPVQPTLEAALDFLWLAVPEPEEATTVMDLDTMQEAGVFSYKRGEETFVELTYLIETGETVVRLMRSSQEGAGQEMIYDLGGRLWHHQLERSAFLTPQVRQLQKLLNKEWTVLSRNLDTAGFVAEFFLDSSPPGTWSKEADGTPKFTPEPLQMGSGSVNFVGPSVTEDEKGNVRYGNPTYVSRQPVNVATFTQSLDTTRGALMEELYQSHTLITGDAIASGKSRVQALADYILSLRETKQALDAAIRWVLETALALGAVFMGQPGRYEALRAEANCRLDVGPVDPETMRMVIDLVDAELLSRETGMGRVGVDDPAAEKERIAQERAERMATIPAPLRENAESAAQGNEGNEDDEGGTEVIGASEDDGGEA
jgi:hypothetical protein